MRSKHFSFLRRERGVSTLAVLVAILPVVVVSAAGLNQVLSGHEEGQQRIEVETARTGALSGAHDALARVSRDYVFERKRFSGTYEFELNSGRATVTVEQFGDDGVDNDGDGYQDEDDEQGLFEVTSRASVNLVEDDSGGSAEQVGRTISSNATLMARLLELDFAFSQAIYLDDPLAQLDLNGGAFLISGNDEHLDGSDGSGDSRPAIGLPGDPGPFIDQIGRHQRSRLIGNLPSPAIGTTDRLVFDDYRDELEPLATLVWEDLSASHSGGIGSYEPIVPLIAYAKGDLTLHGGTYGSGVLIVDGDLEINGKFYYGGVVLVRGQVRFNGGGSAQEVHGAIAVWGDSSSPYDLRISGTVQVSYSVQGLQLAAVTAGVETLFWRNH